MIHFAIFIFVYGISMSIQIYAMLHFPHSNGYSCIPSNGIQLIQILFTITSSTLLAANTTMTAYLWKKLSRFSCIREGSNYLGIGSITMISTFCSYCTLPLLGSFGISSFFSIVSGYQQSFQILSIVILAIHSLWLTYQIWYK